jgi:pyridoxal phosphate enzyme (YggS family)
MPPDLRTELARRIADMRSRLAAACARAGRNPTDVTLVAITKIVTPEVAALLPGLGVSDLGESRPQKLWEKAAAIPAARWHLVGHLQRNKLDKTLPLTTLVHSVDSERLLSAIHEFGVKRGSPVPVLLEVNCSREPAKGGFAPEAVPAVADGLAKLTGVSVQGLMTMAADTDDPELARPTFAELRTLRDELRTQTGFPLPHLSMGMSGDFEIAAEEGATLVRLGSVLLEGLEAP